MNSPTPRGARRASAPPARSPRNLSPSRPPLDPAQARLWAGWGNASPAPSIAVPDVAGSALIMMGGV
jgi:hypothetical protein